MMLRMMELDSGSLTEASEFITRNEQDNITLSSLFHKEGRCVMPAAAKYKVFLFRDSTTTVLKGVASFSEGGQILHCLKFTAEEEKKAFCELFSAEIPKDQLFCILGEKTGCDLIALAMNKRKKDVRVYTLMHYAGCAQKLLPPEKLELVRCGTEHLEALAPLQKGYEMEEVLTSPDDFDEAVSRLTMRRFLREQIIYALFAPAAVPGLQRQAVAKAGTNALGLNWYQLGGIYTLPAFRGRGCAAFLAQTLAEVNMAANKKTALFVKNINIPAQKAYKKAGFVPDKPFEIIYY